MAAGPAEFAATQFTPNGLPGIFVPYLLPEQTLSRAFMNEFVNVRLKYYRKLPFSSIYIIWIIVYHHRPDHLVSTGPNKLLRPTGIDAIRHCLCIVSHYSNHLNGISYDIVSLSISAVASPFGVLVFQEVSLIIHWQATRTYFGVYAVALNTARDMGARLMAITIWGLQGKPTILSFAYTQQGHHDV